MQRHVNEVHAKIKNFICETCGKCFARKDKLRSHEFIHLKDEEGDDVEKPFLCHQCGKGFSREAHVSRHQKVGILGCLLE